jgi:type III secretion system YscQ/HrcQ family protein
MNPDQASMDPFAVDMFATDHSFGTTAARRSMSPRGAGTLRVNQSWNSRLPRVNSDLVETSAALARLRPETYAQIQNAVVSVLSRYSMTPPDQISVSLIDLQEKDFRSEAVTPNERPGVFATFTLGSQAATISIELDVQFAAMLVDRMLGGDGAAPEQLRSLTTTERAAIEFLYLSAVSELNAQSGEPLARLQSIGDQSKRPDWKRGLLASLRIGVGGITGISHVYLKRESLAALDDVVRRLRAAQESALSYTIEELQRYARFAPELSLAVLIGKTDVTPAELSQLESGDVMVVEWPTVRWREERISGSLLLRVGDGDEAWIIGQLSETSDAEPDTLAVKVDAVNTEPPPRFAERLKMEEQTENVEVPGEGASLIEAVMVSVRVELAARRLQLDELSRLRRNQILDLGCNATDPVDLVVDGRRIASGELVDIEGRLGVRITKVLD